MHSVITACTITTLITTYIYIASFKVQLSQQLHYSVSYRWGYRNKEKARQHEINLKRLDLNLPVVTDPIQNDSFRLSAAIKFVPPFDDVDMTQFLNAFEKLWLSIIFLKINGLS